jgi:alpha-methylacyl-CoA racemase
MVGDYGGGAMVLAFGVVCALLAAQRGGSGQVVDAAMVDGTASLMTMFWTLREVGAFDERQPGTNLLDTGAPFYDVYECADGAFVSVGALEPQFYAELLRRLDLESDEAFADQMNRAQWPIVKERLADLFRSRTRDEWCAVFDGTDACVVPVLTMSEAAAHPHNMARRTFVDIEGRVQPAPAPRFSRTPATVGRAPAHPGQHSREILADWGMSAERIEALVESGAVVDA